jgi:hypothetical protein
MTTITPVSTRSSRRPGTWLNKLGAGDSGCEAASDAGEGTARLGAAGTLGAACGVAVAGSLARGAAA